MRKGFLKRVRNVIKDSDLVVEVVDARFPEVTRNLGLERDVLSAGKKLLVVLNKADLVGKGKLEKDKRKISRKIGCVYISSTGRVGSRKLREAIGKLLGKKGGKVGVVGYPNTGKSSLINLLRGKKVAPRSATAGFTKGEQFVRVSEKILLIDTPGIIPMGEMDEEMLALVCSKSVNQLKDVVSAAEFIVGFIVRENKKALEGVYGIKVRDKSAEEVLEEIAVSKKRLKSGGLPDVDVAARMLIRDWQTGKVKIY